MGVTVQTVLTTSTSDGVVQAAPDSTALQQQIQTDMGIEVEASTTVVSQSTQSCTDGVCGEATETVLDQVAAQDQGTASLALGMRGHLPFASLSAIALWSLTSPSA